MSKTTILSGAALLALAGCGPSRAEQFENFLRQQRKAEAEEERERYEAELAAERSREARLLAAPSPLAESAKRSEAQRIQLHAAVASFAWFVLGDDVERRLEAYDPGLDLLLRRESDRGAIERVLIGEADVALVSVALSRHEQDRSLVEHEIMDHAWVLTGHKDMGLNSLTRAQLRSVLNGELTSLTSLGGAAGDLRLLVPGTRTAHEHAAMQLIPGDRFAATAVRSMTVAEMITDLQRYRTAVAVMPFTVARAAGLHMLAVDGVPALAGERLNPQYPFQSRVRLVSRLQTAPGIGSLVEGLRTLQEPVGDPTRPQVVRR